MKWGPSRKLTYPTWGKGKSSTQICQASGGYVNSLEAIDATHVTFTIQPLSRWWQLKYFLFSPRTLGKIPILTNIFRRSWNTNQLCVGRNFICCENNSGDKTGQSLKLSPHFLWHQTQILCWKLPLQPCYLKWRRLSKRGGGIFFSFQSPHLKPSLLVSQIFGKFPCSQTAPSNLGEVLKCSTFSLWAPCAFLLKKMYR